MRRIGLAITLMLALALTAEAQQPRIARIGVLFQGSPPPGTGLFAPALGVLGYVEGRNVLLDRRWAYGESERFRPLAEELVASKPDVIVADSTPAAIALARTPSSIPIVMVNVSDPVGSGLVDSLAHPGRNVTGGTDFGVEMAVKAVDLVHVAVPRATRIAVLMSDNPVHPAQLKEIQAAAKSIGLTVLPTLVRTEDDFEAAIRSMKGQGADALIFLGGAPLSTPAQIVRFTALAAKAKLPSFYPGSGFVDNGGLMSYGSSAAYRWKMAAFYVERILKGAKPNDLPVQQPAEFELVINLKTAKAIGTTIPDTLLIRADRVIE
jgi:putative tryptophan/tyrosine transport system substrate-binding protein